MGEGGGCWGEVDIWRLDYSYQIRQTLYILNLEMFYLTIIK